MSLVQPPVAEIDTQDSALSRRDFVRTGVGAGFAAAVWPVVAETTRHTPEAGLLTGEVSIDVQGFSMPAYRAMPAGGRNLPVILLVSEIFGVHEHIADVARRLAHQGYLVVAPELFVRQGDVGSYAEIGKLMSEVIGKVPDAQVMGDLDACVSWAASQGGDISRVGITGFCWGGRITWLYAAHNPKVRAAVAWYGRLAGTVTALTPKHPLDLTGQLNAPVLGLYGGQDGGIPLESVEKMRVALKSGSPAARQSEFVVYPGAPHAFHADYRPSYRREPAEDGWQRCLGWFREHGVI
jgi:carboxymethylenebutenolidase